MQQTILSSGFLWCGVIILPVVQGAISCHYVVIKDLSNDMTAILNSVVFEKTLEKYWKRYSMHSCPGALSIMFIDLTISTEKDI